MSIKKGDMVRVKNGLCTARVPEGRVDNRTAKVRSIGEQGEVHTDRDLNGCRWWNAAELQRVGVRPVLER